MRIKTKTEGILKGADRKEKIWKSTKPFFSLTFYILVKNKG